MHLDKYVGKKNGVINSSKGAKVRLILALSLFFSLFQVVPSHAAFNAPSFPKVPVQIIADNDYAIMLGNESGPTSLYYKNMSVWGTQLASASVIDVTPGVTDTYIYILAIGGGGDENWGGTINGQDVIYYPGAQVAINPGDPQVFKDYFIYEMDPSDPGASPQLTNQSAWVTKYLDFGPSIPDLSAHQSGCVGTGCDTVSNGGYTEPNLVSYLQSGLVGAQWTTAFYDQYQYQPDDVLPMWGLPRPKTSMFGQCVACDNSPSDGSGKAWEFPSKSAVLFRYSIQNLYAGGLVPVAAGDQQVELNWNAPSGGTTPAGYLVQYKVHSDTSWSDFGYTSAQTSIVTGLINGTNYDFRVRAVDVLDPSAQPGPASNVKSGTPLGAASAPSILTKVSSATSVALTFSAPADNGGLPITNYQYSTDGGNSWLNRSPASTSTSITIGVRSDGSGTALNLNNQYDFKLRAITDYGTGAESGLATTYRLTYDLNGASGAAPTTRTHFEGETFALAAAPTRAGYLFNGWFDGSQIYSIPNNSSNYTLGASDWAVQAEWLSLAHPIVRTGAQNNNATDGELWSWYGNNVHTLSDVKPGWCVVGGNNHSPDWVVSSVVRDQQSTTVRTNTDFRFDGGGWDFSPDPVISLGSQSSQSINLGAAISSASVTNTGCHANKFVISPSLPSGLSFDTATGTISGTPQAIQNSSYYTVTAERWVDTSTGIMDLSGTRIGYSSATFTLAVSIPGFTVTYLPGTGGTGTAPIEGMHLQGETFTVSSGLNLSRSGFYISHWSDGSTTYLPGSIYTVAAQNITLTPTWRQASLRGIEDNELTLAGTIVSSSITSTTTTVSAGSNSVSIQVPSGSFSDTTTVTIYSISNTNLARSLISNDRTYVVNIVVAWQDLNGTVPTANIPIVITINNASIQAGATIYQIVNGVATSTGTTSQNGVAVVNLTTDPLIAVANPPAQTPPPSSSNNTPSVQIKSAKVTNYSPISGPTSGGTTVTVEFDSLNACTISGVNLGTLSLGSNEWRISGNQLLITTPKYDLGEVLIRMVSNCTTEIAPLTFTFLAPPVIEIIPQPLPEEPSKPLPEEPSKPLPENKPTVSMSKLGAAYFALNSSALTVAAQKAIKVLASRIMKSSAKEVLVYGNTDSQGGVDNQLLSKKRALSVAKYLRPLITQKKIVIGWFADSRPAVPGKTLAAFAKNRRVEIWVK